MTPTHLIYSIKKSGVDILCVVEPLQNLNFMAGMYLTQLLNVMRYAVLYLVFNRNSVSFFDNTQYSTLNTDTNKIHTSFLMQIKTANSELIY